MFSWSTMKRGMRQPKFRVTIGKESLRVISL